MRALASARGLLALCESTPAGAVPLLEGGRLVVLTAAEAIPAFEHAEAALVASHRLTFQRIGDGTGIFAHMPDAVTSVHVDPGSPGAAVYDGERLIALRDMARSCAVVNVAANPGACDAATFRRVMREHHRFVVPLQRMAAVPTGDKIQALQGEVVDGAVVLYEILHFKRADGTHYAVVFTWTDCAEAFFAALGDRTRTATIDGATLFAELRRLEETYGATSIVFDMEGPTPQSWMKIGAWRLVLDEPG